MAALPELAGAAVRPGPETRGVGGRHPLREQRCDHACQHVAGAGGGQRWTARGEDGEAPVGQGQHRAGAFDQRSRAGLRRERQRVADPVGLDFARGDAEQARRLQRMRREHRGRGAGCQLAGECRVVGDQVQGVGVEHQRQRGPQRPLQGVAGPGGAAQSAADADCVDALVPGLEAAGHQLRLAGVEDRSVRGGHEDLARAGGLGAARRQQRSASGAGGAADDQHAAEAALVTVARPGAQQFHCERASEQFAVGCVS
jgi:hypothetical protein